MKVVVRARTTRGPSLVQAVPLPGGPTHRIHPNLPSKAPFRVWPLPATTPWSSGSLTAMVVQALMG